MGVAWSALFADTTKEPRLRVAAMKASQISILLSVNIIAITEKLSHSLEVSTFMMFSNLIQNMDAFRIIAIVVGIIAYGCYCITGAYKGGLPTVSTEDKEHLLSDSTHTDSSQPR